MARRWVQGKYRRNNYQHEIFAKVGTKALTIIYVDCRTAVKKQGGKLKPGDRIKWRERNWVGCNVMTGIVAEETEPGGILFITLM